MQVEEPNRGMVTESETEPEILVRERGSLLHVTLNRPRALNALTVAMVTQLRDLLSAVDAKGYSAVLIDGAGERGLCGGGDVKQLSASTPAGAHDFLATEYQADLLTSTLRTPVVSFMTGITMGGGIGISGHARLRVVSEDSRLAMPETRIGLSPDVGGNALLARAPGRLGEYLATTAESMTAGDALACGFADAFVPREQLAALTEALVGGADPFEAVSQFAEPAPESELLRHRDWIDECFNRDSILDVMDALDAHPSESAQETADLLRTLSPVAVVTSFWAVRLAKRGDALAQVFERDLRAMTTLLEHFDGREGIRARIIDKDNEPVWNPARIEDVTVAQLEQILGAEVLELLVKNQV